ncbi:hypothetical protein HOT75_gp140 [Gordonia phage Daredevil]|uniref:Uncharacterized protein n=1 Tax=Gordonia phage Daredevil TaxID=2283286 RepID=A0A345MIZ5_9CAUD|nr:hypothetical protein HOT75_gp140 [Gordonia phage Daredevil]AXH70526.1 hypothetical protein SEA_DAREDEVIL_140 [Gordonia phage Daredevil]
MSDRPTTVNIEATTSKHKYGHTVSIDGCWVSGTGETLGAAKDAAAAELIRRAEANFDQPAILVDEEGGRVVFVFPQGDGVGTAAIALDSVAGIRRTSTSTGDGTVADRVKVLTDELNRHKEIR